MNPSHENKECYKEIGKECTGNYWYMVSLSFFKGFLETEMTSLAIEDSFPGIGTES